jgi:hypothetical protein
VTHVSEPVERPDTHRLAKGPGALVHDGAYLLACLSVPHGRDRDRHVRPVRHTREATRVERVQPMAYRLRRTAPGGRATRGGLSRSAREPYLAAPHGEGSSTAQPSCERGALCVCDMANIARWFHRAEHRTQDLTCTTTLLKLH